MLLREPRAFVEPTLVTLTRRASKIAAGGLISAAVGAWPHGAAETDLGADVAAPWSSAAPSRRLLWCSLKRSLRLLTQVAAISDLKCFPLPLSWSICSATNSVPLASTTTSSTMNSDFAMSHGDLLRTAVRAASLCAPSHSTPAAALRLACGPQIFLLRRGTARRRSRRPPREIATLAQVHKKNSIDHMSRPASTASIARPASQASVGSRASRARTPASRAGARRRARRRRR